MSIVIHHTMVHRRRVVPQIMALIGLLVWVGGQPAVFKLDRDEAVLDLQAICEESLEIARDQPTLPDGSQLNAN